MKLTTAQVYGFAKQAGFKGLSAVMITAIVAAESANKTDAIGDVNLTEPGEKSVGLTQINFRPSRDIVNGKVDAVRDPVANLDPQTNMNHAYSLSRQGTRWSPWSTYTNGAYVKFLGGARAAAGQPAVPLPSTANGGTGTGSGTGATNVNWFTDLLGGAANAATFGLSSAVPDAIGGLISKAQGGLLAGVRGIALQVIFIGGGLTLLVMGAREAVAPAVKRQTDKVIDTAGELAPVAAAL